MSSIDVLFFCFSKSPTEVFDRKYTVYVSLCITCVILRFICDRKLYLFLATYQRHQTTHCSVHCIYIVISDDLYCFLLGLCLVALPFQRSHLMILFGLSVVVKVM